MGGASAWAGDRPQARTPTRALRRGTRTLAPGSLPSEGPALSPHQGWFLPYWAVHAESPAPGSQCPIPLTSEQMRMKQRFKWWVPGAKGPRPGCVQRGARSSRQVRPVPTPLGKHTLPRLFAGPRSR